MAVRQLVMLREYGYQGSQADFHRALAEVKQCRFPNLSDEELTYTRDEADVYCNMVRIRVGLPALPRAFILRSLIGVRKHPLKI